MMEPLVLAEAVRGLWVGCVVGLLLATVLMLTAAALVPQDDEED